MSNKVLPGAYRWAEDSRVSETPLILEAKPGFVWRPMTTAPKDGWSFLCMSRVIIVGGGKPPRLEFRLSSLRRVRSSPESDGYWSDGVTSIPDSFTRASWWAYPHMTLLEGRMVLPYHAFTEFTDLLAWQESFRPAPTVSLDESVS